MKGDAIMRTDFWTRSLFHEEDSAEELRNLSTNMPVGDEEFRRELMSTMFNGMKLPLEQGDMEPEMSFQQAFWDKYGSGEDFESLLDVTAGDEELAAAGAQRIANAVSKVMEKTEPPEPDENGEPTHPDFDWMKDAMTQDGTKPEIAGMVAEISQTSTELKDAKKMVQSMGWGNEAGKIERGQVKAALDLSRRFNIKLFMDLVGRLRGQMRQQMAAEMDATAVQMSGVETGKDIARLIPTQWMLPTPTFLKRHAADQLLQYEFNAPPGEKEGPFVVMIDKSGSMSLGNRWEIAQAIAVSIGWLAATQERDCHAIVFDHQVHFSKKIDSVSSIIELISVEPSGGTSFDNAIVEALKVASETEGVGWDLIMVCDAQCNVSKDVESDLANADPRLHALFVDTAVGGNLMNLCSSAAKLSTQSMGDMMVPVFKMLKEMS